MAKKKKAIEEEVIIEEAVDTAEDAVEIAEVDEPIENTIEEEPVAEEKQDNSMQFVYEQLKAINKLNNPAKARRLAERVLRNRKR